MRIISDNILLKVLTGMRYIEILPADYYEYIMSYNRFWAFIYFQVFWCKIRQKRITGRLEHTGLLHDCRSVDQNISFDGNR